MQTQILRRPAFASFPVADMPWTGKFKTPLALKDGRTIETLAEARAVILSLPEHRQRRPYWEYAAQLLMAAAQAGKP